MVFPVLKKIHKAFLILRLAFWKQYKGQILVMTTLGFVGSIMGGLGIGMLIPIFSLVIPQNDPNSSSSIFRHLAEKIFSFFNFSYSIPLLLALMALFFIVKAVLTIVTSYISDKISGKYECDTGSVLFKTTLDSNWAFLMNQKVGYVDRVITYDVSVGGNMLKTISEAILKTASLITYAFIAFKISSPITLASLIGGGIILLILKPLFHKTRKLGRAINMTGKQLSHHINESLIGVKSIKSFAVESAVAEKGAYYFETIRQNRLKSSLISGFKDAVFEPISLLLIAGIFAFSYKSPAFDIASFAVIIYLIQKMYVFIQGIQGKLDGLNNAFTYLDTMLNYQSGVKNNQEESSGAEPFRFNNSIEFNGVGFTYPNVNLDTLADISFTINKGEMVGIIGPSGSGKTTLVDLFLQLLKLHKGTIKIDNIDIRSIDMDDLRKNISYVSQDVFLLNDTVEANIRFYDQSISNEEIKNAAKMANIYDFIQELPNKFETQVGERGVKLSGGQRQRISLARALAKKASILILDEATSSIDNESEALIQNSINDLRGKITVLAIAHRLSTVINTNRIIVIDTGKIIESGDPAELIKNIDSYLYKSFHVKDSQTSHTDGK